MLLIKTVWIYAVNKLCLVLSHYLLNYLPHRKLYHENAENGRDEVIKMEDLDNLVNFKINHR